MPIRFMHSHCRKDIIEDKLDDLAPRVHDFLLSNDPLSVPPEIDLEPVPDWTDENELFRD